jgi:hypothetical protein
MLEGSMAARWLIAAGLLIASVTVSSAQMRLAGLDRFYFDHIAGPSDQLPGLLRVIDSLPDNLRWPSAGAVQDEKGTIVQDFPLPGFDSDRQVWIREIRVTTKGGIDVLWWALYDSGLRSDLWTYAANRIRHDDKVLCDYRVHSVVDVPFEAETDTPSEAEAFRSIVLRVCGELDAKEGWRRSGYEWTLSVRDDSLVVSGARTVFDLYRPAEPSSLLQASAESPGDPVEIVSIDASPELLEKCGLSDPGEIAWEFAWTQLSEASQCLLSSPEAERSTRGASDPSLIERGPGE